MRIEPRELATRDGRGFVVRDCRPGEAGALLDLARLVHETTPEFTERDADELTITVDQLRAAVGRLQGQPNSLSIAAAAGRGVVGVLSLHGGRERKFRHTADLGMHVHPGWRGVGVGTALIETALEVARATPMLRRVTLQVFANNERARRLYERCGFVEEGRLRGHVRIGDDYVDDIQMAVAV